MKPSLVIFLHSHTFDRLYQAVSLILSASSMGWPCHLFLFYQALSSFLEDAWAEPRSESGSREDEMGVPSWQRKIEDGFASANLPSLYDMLEKARGEEGGLRICACSASVRILGLDSESVRAKVDDIVGLPTMLRVTETATHAWYI
jgi:peroxiredoxin family protein